MGGAILGGLFLCMLAFVLICVMRTDPEMSQRMDMPMPEFARRLSPWLNVMLFAIYSSVAENYYNFPLRLKEERDLEYILPSHTHYDHVGALPHVRRRWPDAVVYAAEHGKRVLERPGALKVIGYLGATAAKEYTNGKMELVLTEGLAVHTSLKDGDELSLGDKRILVLGTKGRTDCSMTYIIQLGSIMTASESTGGLAYS